MMMRSVRFWERLIFHELGTIQRIPRVKQFYRCAIYCVFLTWLIANNREFGVVYCQTTLCFRLVYFVYDLLWLWITD